MVGKKNYIIGIRPLIEAIKTGKEVEKVLLKKGLKSIQYEEILELLKLHNISCQHVPIERLNRITQSNHQGVIAFISQITIYKLDSIIPFVFEQGRNPLILLLDHITDVRNFGAICRTAECVGVDAVVVPISGAAQINADAIKASAGALYSLPVCKAGNLRETVKYLKNCGLCIIAASEKALDVYYDADFTVPAAIILGAEDKGISADLLKVADKQVKIPVSGSIESLNVSASASVILYEAIRQRRILLS